MSVTSEQATKIHAGVAVHEAMPESSPEDREQIISGTHPQCWEDMFG